jgi:hypothetical protein
MVLIDKNCPGIASINDRHAGWNRIESISQKQNTGLARWAVNTFTA